MDFSFFFQGIISNYAFIPHLLVIMTIIQHSSYSWHVFQGSREQLTNLLKRWSGHWGWIRGLGSDFSVSPPHKWNGIRECLLNWGREVSQLGEWLQKRRDMWLFLSWLRGSSSNILFLCLSLFLCLFLPSSSYPPSLSQLPFLPSFLFIRSSSSQEQQ